MMWTELQDSLDRAMKYITADDQMDKVLAAQKIYQELTGVIDQDSEVYELRMYCFYEWFLFHYLSHNDQSSLIVQIEEMNPNANVNAKNNLELIAALKRVNYSVFEFLGQNLKKQFVFQDLLHQKKMILAKDHRQMAMIKGDVFVGRSLVFQQQQYFLYGILLLPGDIKRKLVRELKWVRKLTNPKDIENFILFLEQLRNRWNHYLHVEAHRFFDFSSLNLGK